jgi:hypothetical protein
MNDEQKESSFSLFSFSFFFVAALLDHELLQAPSSPLCTRDIPSPPASRKLSVILRACGPMHVEKDAIRERERALKIASSSQFFPFFKPGSLTATHRPLSSLSSLFSILLFSSKRNYSRTASRPASPNACPASSSSRPPTRRR